jgi:bifunctional DNase/RNase
MSESDPTPENVVSAPEVTSDAAPVDEAGLATEPVATEPAATESLDADTTTVFRVVSVESVVFDLSDPSPQVHLMETEAPYRHVSVPIALPEAQALDAAMFKVAGRRPSTHELMSSILETLRADIIAVRIVRYDQGVFYAELDLMTAKGREKFDCRCSDGFILALRQAVPAPILCDEDVLAYFYV